MDKIKNVITHLLHKNKYNYFHLSLSYSRFLSPSPQHLSFDHCSTVVPLPPATALHGETALV